LRGFLAQSKEAGSVHSQSYVRVLLTRHCVKKTARQLRFYARREYNICFKNINQITKFRIKISFGNLVVFKEEE
jgi:altronate dehydratase